MYVQFFWPRAGSSSAAMSRPFKFLVPCLVYAPSSDTSSGAATTGTRKSRRERGSLCSSLRTGWTRTFAVAPLVSLLSCARSDWSDELVSSVSFLLSAPVLVSWLCGVFVQRVLFLRLFWFSPRVRFPGTCRFVRLTLLIRSTTIRFLGTQQIRTKEEKAQAGIFKSAASRMSARRAGRSNPQDTLSNDA